MTIQSVPVLTITGTCGQTIHYDIDGRLVAFSCAHATASTSGGAVSGKGEHTTRDIFDSGGGGGVAMVVDTLDRLSREGRTDDHLVVIKSDGQIADNANQYREVLNAQDQQNTGPEPVQVDLGTRVQSYLGHDIDEDAQPFIVVFPRTAGSIRADQLLPTLHAAAEARAPIRLMTL
jgi:hypothetical protein